MQRSRESISDDEDAGYASSSSDVTTNSTDQPSLVDRSKTQTTEQYGRPLPRNRNVTITPMHDSVDDDFPPIRKRKTAIYDPVKERQTSYAESKQFYQKHQLDSQNVGDDTDTTSPPMPAKSFSASLDGGTSILQSPHPIAANGKSSEQYQSALPVELGQPAHGLQSPASPRDLRTSNTHTLLEADEAARQQGHPSLPHEQKGTFLESIGLHGAGAGIGVGTGQGGFASSDATVMTELSTIHENISKILDLRHKFIRLSLQGETDNPKDEPGWRIYPPAPETVSDAPNKPRAWNDDGNGDSSVSGQIRKLGKDIGADFHLQDMLPLPGKSEMTFKLDDGGVFQVYETSESVELETPIVPIPALREWYIALDTVINAAADGPSKTYAYRRLQFLEKRFELYMLANEYQETADSKQVPHRDFYNVRKVDTHVHHSACMNAKHLLRFIKSKMKKCPDEKVITRDGKSLSLKEVFESIGLTAYDLSIDTLDMHAHKDAFHRFDRFNLKYNPVGESRLRTIFLKTDNDIQGRYLAELTKEVIADLESSKYQFVEWRISIYGRSPEEWDKLAAWVVDNKIFSHNVRWLIQVPRLYSMYKKIGELDNFEQLISNLFKPLFEVTQDPASHPKLHIFLQRVIGFDTVDDESKAERRHYRKFPKARDWNMGENPPYTYYIYYLFANIASLNVWRKQRGFNIFLLRPHCGEAGDPDHIAAAVLCCHSISHGLVLRKIPLLQYVFYLEQIGIAMSPLSNNALFLPYDRNPFRSYFNIGLNVSLSTDDPLQFHYTKEPLVEEYAVAAQIHKLSAVDMCELAKNSVLQSGFEHALKQKWLGTEYQKYGTRGNDPRKTNVPAIRAGYRHEALVSENAMTRHFGAPKARLSVSNLEPQKVIQPEQTPASPDEGVAMSVMTHPSATNPMHASQTFSAVGLPQAALSPPLQDKATTDGLSASAAAMYHGEDDADPNDIYNALARTTSHDLMNGHLPRLSPGMIQNSERTRRRSSVFNSPEIVARASANMIAEETEESK